MAGVVIAERGQEHALAGQPRELNGSNRAATADLLPGLERVHDLARLRDALDPGELDPFDVADDCHPHAASLRPRRNRVLQRDGDRGGS
jgi:hypothetical protein